MRLLMEVLIPVEKGNEAVADGSLSKAFEEFIATAQPEAAYFHLWQGKRAALFIFEETKQDKLMAYNENLFAVMNAEITITPTLSHKELNQHL